MKIDIRGALVLFHPTDPDQILLLKRSNSKKLFPNLITGIGGKVELDQGEGEDLESSLLREFTEETSIPKETVRDIHLRLSTITNREELVVLLWYTGHLTTLPQDLACTEGVLAFYNKNNLPLSEMIPTAGQAIPFITSLPETDTTVYAGAFPKSGTGLVISAP